MIRFGEGLLICDLAETYGIYDMRAYKPSFIGLLAKNLRSNSRIKMALAGISVELSDLLLAIIADKLSNLVWMFSEDGQKRQNPPKSITGILTGRTDENDAPVTSYESPEEFMKAMEKYQ